MGAVIGVAGATGALGKEVVKVLDDASWRPDRIVPLASAATTTSFVEYGEDSVAVDDLADQEMDELDALILAVPAPVAQQAGEKAVSEGIPVIDCSGVFDQAPMIVPWVNPEALVELPLDSVVTIPQGPALLLGGVLGPLRRAGVAADVEATVLVPASSWGRSGIEELSAQVVALFNQGNPPRKVFKEGLAFDLLPVLGTPDDTGWSDEERRAHSEVERLIGPGPLRVTLIGVPVFTGISAAIHLRTAQHLDPALVERILADGGVGLPKSPGARHLPRPRRVDGMPFAQVGRVRRDPTGPGLHLWASLDNLRGTAAAAVAATGALLKRRTLAN